MIYFVLKINIKSIIPDWIFNFEYDSYFYLNKSFLAAYK